MAHRWLVLIAAVFVSTFEFGLLFSLSALFIPILETFDTDRATAALVQSISLGVTMSTGIITGLIVKIVGYRKVSFLGAVLSSLGYVVSYFADTIVFLTIFLGIIAGIGIAFMYISGTVTVVDYFEEPGKSLALAAVQTGVGIAGVFYPYVLTFLYDTYGLQSTFLIIGGIFLNNFAVCVLFNKPVVPSKNKPYRGVLRTHNKDTSDNDETTPLLNSEIVTHDDTYSIVKKSKTHLDDVVEQIHFNYKGQTVYKHIKVSQTQNDHGHRTATSMSRVFQEAFKSCKELFSNTIYILFLLGDSLVVAFANGFIAVVVDIFTTKGLSSEEGLSAFLPYFLASIVGRILPGILQQSPKVNPLLLPFGCAILGILGQLCVLLSSDYTVLMIGCSLAGLSVGGAISSSSVVAVRLVNKEAFPLAFGLIMSLSGILTAIVAPLNGFIRDTTGRYSVVQMVTAGSQFVGGVLLVIVLILKGRSEL